MNAERITGLAILMLALLIYFVLIPIGIVSPENLKHISTAPYFWPSIIAGIMGFTGILMMLFAKPDTDTPNAGSDDQLTSENNESELSWLTRLPRLLLTGGLLFAFYFSIPYLGMVVPGMLLIIVLMFFAGQRRWFLMLGLSVSVPLLLYGFFVHVASIPIPLGWFEVLRG